MTRDEAKNKIIFALDVDKLSEIGRWAELLADKVGMFKVGKELFTTAGPAAVDAVKRHGGQVFLDLKYHDIPNTVAQAMLAAGRLGVRLANLHALGGPEMMEQTASAEGLPSRVRRQALRVLARIARQGDDEAQANHFDQRAAALD